ncbi:LOW QUALITY PROTEIN: hypothetical protein Dda_7349 [Drechslerella dactyloides]|uniref:Uncharacterized protein n=1 Tax=Drechslerella dactyloides TaxID=74499 RepID=A0AAD6IS37_DREDA|nr:LOW QUALITY PROTEIN: hypothetical protein Dda_7349 [Drechslerella dactyloides]
MSGKTKKRNMYNEMCGQKRASPRLDVVAIIKKGNRYEEIIDRGTSGEGSAADCEVGEAWLWLCGWVCEVMLWVWVWLWTTPLRNKMLTITTLADVLQPVALAVLPLVLVPQVLGAIVDLAGIIECRVALLALRLPLRLPKGTLDRKMLLSRDMDPCVWIVCPEAWETCRFCIIGLVGVTDACVVRLLYEEREGAFRTAAVEYIGSNSRVSSCVTEAVGSSLSSSIPCRLFSISQVSCRCPVGAVNLITLPFGAKTIRLFLCRPGGRGLSSVTILRPSIETLLALAWAAEVDGSWSLQYSVFVYGWTQKKRRWRLLERLLRPTLRVYFHMYSPIIVCVMAWMRRGSLVWSPPRPMPGSGFRCIWKRSSRSEANDDTLDRRVGTGDETLLRLISMDRPDMFLGRPFMSTVRVETGLSVGTVCLKFRDADAGASGGPIWPVVLRWAAIFSSALGGRGGAFCMVLTLAALLGRRTVLTLDEDLVLRALVVRDLAERDLVAIDLEGGGAGSGGFVGRDLGSLAGGCDSEAVDFGGFLNLDDAFHDLFDLDGNLNDLLDDLLNLDGYLDNFLNGDFNGDFHDLFHGYLDDALNGDFPLDDLFDLHDLLDLDGNGDFLLHNLLNLNGHLDDFLNGHLLLNDLLNDDLDRNLLLDNLLNDDLDGDLDALLHNLLNRHLDDLLHNLLDGHGHGDRHLNPLLDNLLDFHNLLNGYLDNLLDDDLNGDLLLNDDFNGHLLLHDLLHDNFDGHRLLDNLLNGNLDHHLNNLLNLNRLLDEHRDDLILNGVRHDAGLAEGSIVADCGSTSSSSLAPELISPSSANKLRLACVTADCGVFSTLDAPPPSSANNDRSFGSTADGGVLSTLSTPRGEYTAFAEAAARATVDPQLETLPLRHALDRAEGVLVRLVALVGLDAAAHAAAVAATLAALAAAAAHAATVAARAGAEAAGFRHGSEEAVFAVDGAGCVGGVGFGVFAGGFGHAFGAGLEGVRGLGFGFVGGLERGGLGGGLEAVAIGDRVAADGLVVFPVVVIDHCDVGAGLAVVAHLDGWPQRLLELAVVKLLTPGAAAVLAAALHAGRFEVVAGILQHAAQFGLLGLLAVDGGLETGDDAVGVVQGALEGFRLEHGVARGRFARGGRRGVVGRVVFLLDVLGAEFGGVLALVVFVSEAGAILLAFFELAGELIDLTLEGCSLGVVDGRVPLHARQFHLGGFVDGVRGFDILGVGLFQLVHLLHEVLLFSGDGVDLAGELCLRIFRGARGGTEILEAQFQVPVFLLVALLGLVEHLQPIFLLLRLDLELGFLHLDGLDALISLVEEVLQLADGDDEVVADVRRFRCAGGEGSGAFPADVVVFSLQVFELLPQVGRQLVAVLALDFSEPVHQPLFCRPQFLAHVADELEMPCGVFDLVRDRARGLRTGQRRVGHAGRWGPSRRDEGVVGFHPGSHDGLLSGFVSRRLCWLDSGAAIGPCAGNDEQRG